MKESPLRYKILYTFIIILIVIYFTLFVLTLYAHFKIADAPKKEVKQTVKKIILDNGLKLNISEYYVALNDEIKLDIENPKNIDYKITFEKPEMLIKEEEKYKASALGTTEFTIEINNFKAFSGTINVINGLRVKDEKFDKKKNFISCNEYSEEENNMLDAALENRVKSVGESTRASVVEVARFITLEFDRRIPYFYENGRLKNYGDSRNVDGEGRYYHKGLYLNKSRYSSIGKKFTGPGAWGCKITQYQDEPGYGFKPRTKMPNGFDCSGFISWVLYNGGFDVGDVGAGDIKSRNDDLYDLGEKNKINNELLDSGRVKVGDLIAYPGHMAIIAGYDAEQDLYYVAESLPQFKGVVLNKYKRAGLKATFTHIMLMDSVYKEDGNLTNMWY